MLRIIDRYIFKESALASVGVIAVLLVILLGNTLVRILGDVAEGKLPVSSLWPMISINLVHYLVVLIPVGLYLGILFGMGRLYKDSEMSALFACGIGSRRLYRGILTLALPLTAIAFFLSLYLAPWTVAKQDEIKQDAKSRSELYGLVPGQFNVSANRKQTLFFETFSGDSGNVMEQVFMHSLNNDTRTVETAERATQGQPAERDGYIIFKNGVAYSGIPGQGDYRITEFATHGILIKQSSSPILSLRTSATPTLELWSRSDAQSVAEWHWRLAIPIACLLLAIFALPLSYTSPRKGRFAKLGMGILIYIIYVNSLGLARAWLEREVVPAWLGIWWVHGLMIMAIMLLLVIRERPMWLQNRFRFTLSKSAAP